jgi:hypothetical protein
MKFGEALDMAMQIVDDVLNTPGYGQQRLAMTLENKPIIDELVAAAESNPFLEWFAMGTVDTTNGYFVIRAKYMSVNDFHFPSDPDPVPDNVIHVDFRARRRVKRAA